jgi:hypothetical protein
VYEYEYKELLQPVNMSSANNKLKLLETCKLVIPALWLPSAAAAQKKRTVVTSGANGLRSRPEEHTSKASPNIQALDFRLLLFGAIDAEPGLQQ